MKNYNAVTVKNCKFIPDKSVFNFQSTDELDYKDDIIWQERAINNIKTGLEITSRGYNIFVSGFVGSGRYQTIIKLLEDINKKNKKISPNDILYVYNFKQPDRPRVISVPSGKGVRFRKNIDDLVENLKKNIPVIYDGDNYRNKINTISNQFKDQHRNLLKEFESKIEKENFNIIQPEDNPYIISDIVPIIAGNKVSMDVLENLVEANKFKKSEYEKIKQKFMELSLLLEIVSRRYAELEKKYIEKLEKINKETILPFIDKNIREIKNKFKNKKITQFLEEVKENVLNNVNVFTRESAYSPYGIEINDDADENNENKVDLYGQSDDMMEEIFNNYKVNLLVDNSETENLPIVVESSPSYKNLIGSIEKQILKNGEMQTDFTKIKAGSFLLANGGYLVLSANDVMEEENLWPIIKRTIRNGKVEIENLEDSKFGTISSLKPEPIPINLKVLLIGDEWIYNLLYHNDTSFKKIFKVKAEFDSEMDNVKDNLLKYAYLVKQLSKEEKILPFDKAALIKLVEYGSRESENQKKLSVKFNVISDLIRESSYWANKENAILVSAEHVQHALQEIKNRKNLVEEKILDLYKEGTILVDFNGSTIGLVNGVSVYDIDDYDFGIVVRITASVSPGNLGIINIEREVALSGPVHDKGIFIITSYLRKFFSFDFPLSLTSSLCFEQNYGEIEGDSASLAELTALLSALSEYPICQNIVVTGSVNQLGDVQPIGGINEKIEGFHHILKLKKYTGTAAIIIPYLNEQNLCLSDEVIEQIKKDKFKIFTVKRVEEACEILMQQKFGSIEEKDSICNRVYNKMHKYAEICREYKM